VFSNNYYGGLRVADIKSRLRRVKFAYRLDQTNRATYKVRTHAPTAKIVTVARGAALDHATTWPQERFVFAADITSLLGADLDLLLQGQMVREAAATRRRRHLFKAAASFAMDDVFFCATHIHHHDEPVTDGGGRGVCGRRCRSR
jgi:hypothetical protein